MQYPGSSELLWYTLLHHGENEAEVEFGVTKLEASFRLEPQENTGRQLAYHCFFYKKKELRKSLFYYQALVILGAWEANFNIGIILRRNPDIVSLIEGSDDPRHYLSQAARHGHLYSRLVIAKINAERGERSWFTY